MRQNRRYPGESKWQGWLYILPALLIYAVFILSPLVSTITNSFFQWDGFSSSKTFIGLQNFVQLLSDSKFHTAILHNLVFIVFYTIIPIMIGLVLASILGRTKIPGFTFFRTVLFLPQILSMVVVGVIWRWVFNPSFGLLNSALQAVGLEVLTRVWLGDFNLALPSVGAIGSWVQYGFCMILFLAGMQHISEEYYEASSLDGANAWHQLLHITIPSLRPEIAVAMVSTIIAALRVFDLVYVTTRGGPGEATLVTGFLIYRTAFLNNQLGYASAIATVLTILILLISLAIRAYQRKLERAA